MQFYGAGYSALGYVAGPQAHVNNVAHRISKSAKQAAKLRDKASETNIRHVLQVGSLGYPIGSLVTYHGTLLSCRGPLFEVTHRQWVGPTQWSKAEYRYILRSVEEDTEALRLHGVREESISIHVQ